MTGSITGYAKSLTAFSIAALPDWKELMDSMVYGFRLIQCCGWCQIEVQFKTILILFGERCSYHETRNAFDTDRLSDMGVGVVIEFEFDFEPAADVDVV